MPSSKSARIGIKSNFNRDEINNIERGAADILRNSIDDTIDYARDRAVDDITGDVHLNRAYILRDFEIKYPVKNKFEGSIKSRHKPGGTTIRKGTYNPTFAGAVGTPGVTMKIGKAKSPVAAGKWFPIKLRGSGYIAVAKRDRTKRDAKGRRALRVVRAPSVNQVFWDVVDKPKYKYREDVLKYLGARIMEKIRI